MPARGGGPPNNGQRLSWLIGPASSMAGLAQTAQQWSVRAARSVCGWYHCTPLGGVRKVRTQEKMYTYLYRLGDRWVRKLERIAQPRSACSNSAVHCVYRHPPRASCQLCQPNGTRWWPCRPSRARSAVQADARPPDLARGPCGPRSVGADRAQQCRLSWPG